MISITNDKIIYSEFGLDSNPNSHREIQNKNIINFLSDDVEFSGDLIFDHFFKIIIDNVEVFNTIFHSALGGYDINDWLPEYKQKSDINENFEIVFSWVADYFEHQGKIECTIYPLFSGYGKFDKEDNEEYSLGLGLTKLCDLKGKKMKLDSTLVIDVFNNDKIKRIIDVDHKPFTLFQIIDAFLREISFHGSPEQRNIFSKQLCDQSEEIDEAIKNGTIDEITTSADDIFKEFGILNIKPSWKKSINLSKTKTYVHIEDPQVLHIIQTGWKDMYCVIIEDGELGYPKMEYLSCKQILEKYDIDVS